MPSTTHSSTARPAVFRGLNLVAGHPALDLINTVKYRGTDDPQDRIGGFDDLVDWAETAGIVSGAEVARVRGAPEGDPLWRKALVLRESLRVLLNSDQLSKAKRAQAIRTIEAAIAGLRPTAVIDPETGILRQVIEVHAPKDVLARIVDCIADLLTRRQDLLIKTCDGCDCDWLFVDRTKARRRRWCDTRTCGNLARVRAHREKHQTTEQNHAG